MLSRHVGAGLIAGASDNDPTTVATLAVVGATTGYGLAWLVVLLLPMLVTVQVISARVGAVTRKDLQTAIRQHFGARWALVAMVLVLAVNLLTVGADLEAGAAALGLLTGLPWPRFVLPLTLGFALLLVVGSYRLVARVLGAVLLVFVAYLAAAVLARPDWGEVVQHTVVPSLAVTPDYTTAILALLGTTLTSYVYFWQTIELAEEHPPLRVLRLVELDAAAGMAFTVVIFYAIVVATGATLGVSGQPVQTAQDAAAALTPIAGPWAGGLFALGLLASAVLAIPILAATSGYVVGATFEWRRSLDEPLNRSTWRFYAVMLGILALGATLSLLAVEPIEMLVIASIAGGLGTPVLLALLLRLARSRRVMGEHRIAGPWMVIGWTTTAIVSLASMVYLVQPLLPP
jgi:Mn2+/Fe2+ NRAMP family transporter